MEDQTALEELASMLLRKRGKSVQTTTLPTTTQPPPHPNLALHVELASLEQERTELNARLAEMEHGKGPFEVARLDDVLSERAALEETAQERLERRKRRRGGGDDAFATTEDEERLNAIVIERSQRRTQLSELADQMNAFRIAGISTFSVAGKDEDLGLRFETTADGFYFDRHYVLLSKSLTVHRHGLPYFIPIQEIETHFLPHDPMGFAKRVSRYLCAWCARDVAVMRLQRALSDERVKIESSEAKDVITLSSSLGGHLNAKCPQLLESVQFTYPSLLDIVPSIYVLAFASEIPGKTYNLTVTRNDNHLKDDFSLAGEFAEILQVDSWD